MGVKVWKVFPFKVCRKIRLNVKYIKCDWTNVNEKKIM